MSKRLLAAFVSLLPSVFGCGTPENSEATSDMAPVEPIKAAFDEREIGKPLDWKSLKDADKAFLGALSQRDAVAAKAALAAGAKADLDCGYGCNTLMLAAATGDAELVATIRKAGVKETPEATPYLEILKFADNAQRPEFKAALAEIEQLSGNKPAPGQRPGLYTLELGEQAAKTFLEKHHARLLKSGCYIFLYDEHFQIDNKPDELWILPTKDKFAIMAFTGVNGINYEIDNHLVILWMKKLDRDHPYLLTGCGSDFLAGHFADRLSDPASMAKKMYTFCPDIVEQGTGSVEKLAEELRKTNQLYFWWD
jgi:hypothetical protein